MAVKPTAPPAPHAALDVIKSSGVGTEPKKPAPAPAPARARPWTWTRIVRYVSLYYLANVIGIGITIDGFRRLVAAGDTDLAARALATGVVFAGNLLRGAAGAVVSILWDTPLCLKVVMIDFALVTVAVALYVHITMDAFGCSSCPCPHQC